jgi:cytochrome c
MAMLKRISIVFAVILLSAGLSLAGGTADEAKSLVKKGVDYIGSDGKAKAFAEFSNQKGKFIDRDLYIFAVDFEGITLAHGGNASLVGKSLKGLKDADGVYFIQKFIELAKAKGSGWVDYKWVNPVSKKIEAKSTYIQKVDNYFLGCGIYK